MGGCVAAVVGRAGEGGARVASAGVGVSLTGGTDAVGTVTAGVQAAKIRARIAAAVRLGVILQVIEDTGWGDKDRTPQARSRGRHPKSPGCCAADAIHRCRGLHSQAFRSRHLPRCRCGLHASIRGPGAAWADFGHSQSPRTGTPPIQPRPCRTVFASSARLNFAAARIRCRICRAGAGIMSAWPASALHRHWRPTHALRRSRTSARGAPARSERGRDPTSVANSSLTPWPHRGLRHTSGHAPHGPGDSARRRDTDTQGTTVHGQGRWYGHDTPGTLTGGRRSTQQIPLTQWDAQRL